MASELSQMPLRRVLLATDFSARCDRALDRAAMLATESAAKLTVVHASEPDIYVLTRDPRPGPSWREQPNLKQAIAVNQLHQDLGQLDVPFDLILEEGVPAEVILRATKEPGGDLVVTGIARGETFGRFIFGGTVDYLVRNGSVPVLVVKNRARNSYNDVVVATDFSEASRKAIEATATIFPNAKITLLHCYEGAQSPLVARVEADAVSRQLSLGKYKEFVNRDSESRSRLGQLPIFIERGELDCVIRSYAADKNLDLLVIGSHGKSALTRALVGSSAEVAMASAPTDVLVIPPP